jgi:glycosyltransferase involved in cell wall biosynthesis
MHSRKYAHAARTCDLIVVNSEFTAGEVVELLGFPRERICVAYPGIGPAFRPDGPARDLGAPYVLTVATLERRKNLEKLLEAMPLVRTRRPELRLAVVGAPGWQAPTLDAEGVIPLGYVDDEELAALYRGAEVFVYPSRFEGFGIPIVEAVACGTRVVASAHPSLNEASGDAAIRADPDSAEALAEAIASCVERRPTGSERLVARGYEYVRRFTPRACGVVILRGYESAEGQSVGSELQ